MSTNIGLSVADDVVIFGTVTVPSWSDSISVIQRSDDNIVYTVGGALLGVPPDLAVADVWSSTSTWSLLNNAGAIVASAGVTYDAATNTLTLLDYSISSGGPIMLNGQNYCVRLSP